MPGWQNPTQTQVDDPATKVAFQDLHDYLGPYHMTLFLNSNITPVNNAETRLPFNAVHSNVGNVFKRSTDGKGIILPWNGSYTVQTGVLADVTVVGVGVNAEFLIRPELSKADEVTVRNAALAYARVGVVIAASPAPALNCSNNFRGLAGDRVYTYYYWNTLATTSLLLGDPLLLYTFLTITYLGKGDLRDPATVGNF